MADVRVLDSTGQPVDLPQEAVASEHAAGKISFVPGTRIPVTLADGTEGSIPAEKAHEFVADGAGKLNFDPSGATKAAAVAGVRGLTMGASDWLAIHGRKLLGDEEGAEHARKVLQALRDEHPVASTVAEAGGALAPLLIPGAGEAEGIGRALGGAAGAVDEARVGAEAVEAGEAAAQLREAGDVARQVAQEDAASGRTVGSALGTLFRHANPNNLMGTIGAGAENYVGRLFGDKLGTLARFGTEGALIGAANALDESELGDTELTGETLLASMEHGALFGSALGLVGTGAEKALTAAGKIAGKVAEGRLGGTAGQFRKALGQWGPGALGNRALEEGIERPFANAAEKYERAREVASRDGQLIEGVVRDADEAYGGASAMGARDELHKAVNQATEEGRLAGGNLDALNGRLKSEFDKAVGWRADPEPMPRIPDGEASRIYEAAWKQKGMMDPNLPPPAPPTVGRERAKWRELADAEGLGTREERVPRRVDPAAVAQYREKVLSRLASTRDPAERAKIGQILTQPASAHAFALEEAQAAVAVRNARRQELRVKARDDLNEKFAVERDLYDRQMKAHDDLRAKAAQHVSDRQAERDRLYAHSVSAVRRANAELKVPIARVREFRAKLDDLIPWGRSGDAITNAALDMKHAARSALEQHVEREMDRAANATGSPELLARYLHAKARYGQAKDIEKMLERQRAREAGQFGRHKFGDYGGIVSHGVAGLVFGHPAAGLAAGALNVAGRKYGPTLAAWALHKVSRFAEMKALRAEVQVAMRRSARAAAAGGAVPKFSSIALPNLPPHEMRATAAEAMAAVLKTARGTDLPSRLAALDPNMNVLAPNTAKAVEGTARRAITWLVTRIPARVQAAMAQGVAPSGKDLADAEARDFLESAAVVSDPRMATDALAHGTLTPTLAVGFKTVWPKLSAQASATMQRQAAMDRPSYDAIPHARKSQMGLLSPMPSLSAAGMTMTLQASAAAMASANARAQPAGRVHAASGLSKLTDASMMETTTQAAESGPAGRRGKARGAGLGL